MADEKKKDSTKLDEAKHPVVSPTPPGGNPVYVTAWPGLDVTLQSTPAGDTFVQGFWEYIRHRTDAISFHNYDDFIEATLCKPGVRTPEVAGAAARFRALNLVGVDGYEILRMATEAFLLVKSGTLSGPRKLDLNGQVDPERLGGQTFDLNEKLRLYLGGGPILPYIDAITANLADPVTVNETVPPPHPNPFFCDNLDAKVLEPFFIELIWPFWIENAGVVQAMNAISLRFQNKRIGPDRDVLANLTLHPLRPVANLLWGRIQKDDERLTVARRAYEYDSQYGLSLVGRAVPNLLTADSRSKFVEAFHSLLHQTAIFYDRSANLTMRADAFPILNALQEVHLILAEGAHNQFRELTWKARVEMLTDQWILSRPEVREFLGGRPAVPYAEEWMRNVESLRRLMGWGDAAITHFNDLAIAGEKILLSIRYADWANTSNVTSAEASGWAAFWKPEIQRYIHAYNAVTGVDLSAATQVTTRRIDATQPSVLLQQRIARQRTR